MHFKDKTFIYLIVAALATWRITNIIQKEEIASPVRKAAGVIEPDGEEPDYWIYPDNFIGKLLHCFWCGSVWVGAGATLLLFIFPPLLIPFALSAIGILIHNWLEYGGSTTIQYLLSEEEEGEGSSGEGEDT